MKANVHTANKRQTAGGGPFHGHELRLTIGLIVKNEEKTLDKCLASMKPLLDAVPSELIITDTGSTDRTKEIARKYTDHIIDFEWCNDFSAARNTAVDIARGEWFMFIDGDEWFEDVTPVAEFFQSGECDQYWSASYDVRNYTDFSGKNYSKTSPNRIIRLYPGARFQNQIHEEIPYMIPLKLLDAFAHHYGYVYRTTEEAEKHNDGRNRKMLEKELEKNPDDLKALFQLGMQLLGAEDQKVIEYVERGADVLRRGEIAGPGVAHVYSSMRQIRLQAMLNLGRDEDVLESLPEALSREKKPSVFHMEDTWTAQQAAYHLKRYEETVRLGEKYEKLYQGVQNGSVDTKAQVNSFFFHITPEARETALSCRGMALLELKRNDEARACAEKLDLALKYGAWPSNVAGFCFHYARKTGDWSLPAEFYTKVCALNDDGKKQTFLSNAEWNYRNYPSRQEAFLRAFAGAESPEGYPLLCRLRLAEREGDAVRADALLESLRTMEQPWDATFSDALYYVLKEKKSLLPFLPRIDVDDATAVAMSMQQSHEDYADVLDAYIAHFSYEDAKAQCCLACLLSLAMVQVNAADDPERYERLIRAYAETLSAYVRAVCRPEALAEPALPVLPRLYRFGWYVGGAFQTRSRGDGAGYLAGLRAALEEYPAMKAPMEFLLHRFKTEQKKQDARAAEFDKLAEQVKSAIEALIAQGNLKQAGIYTLQLAKLMPEDEDVRRYRKLTNTNPTMEELSAHLPQ